MEWDKLFPAGNMPAMEDIEKFVDMHILKGFGQYLEETYMAQMKIEYSNCSAQRGWNIKYKKGSKAVTTIYPMEGYFIALVSVSPKNEPEAELLLHSLTEYTQKLYKKARALPRMGRWLMIEVRDAAILNDVKRLIGIKIEPAKNKRT